MTIMLIHSLFCRLCSVRTLRVDQDDRVSRCLVRSVTGRGGVASAFAGEAIILDKGDLATDVDGIGGFERVLLWYR